MYRHITVNQDERGLVFERGALVRVLGSGSHWLLDPLLKLRIDVVDLETPFLAHTDIEAIIRSGLVEHEAMTLDLKDHERALVWVDGRFSRILGAGRHVLWTVLHEVKVEIVDASVPRFEHPMLGAILAVEDGTHLAVTEVQVGTVALFYVDGVYVETWKPGRYAVWRGLAKAMVRYLDVREQVLDIASQEIMTADKVTLRMTAVVTYVVADPRVVVESVDDHRQAMYRDSQLALRAVVGTMTLDELLAGKDVVAAKLSELVLAKAAAIGVRVDAVGIRDLILPGDMKTLMNKVTEAKKAAEAALITRREETAAMRSQANTAKILEASPTLMKLRELEVLQKVAETSNLTIVLGEHGMSDRLMKLL